MLKRIGKRFQLFWLDVFTNKMNLNYFPSQNYPRKREGGNDYYKEQEVRPVVHGNSTAASGPQRWSNCFF